MKSLFILSALGLVGSCATTKYDTKIENLKNSVVIEEAEIVKEFANTITAEELEFNLYKFASKEFEGRGTGEAGQKKAVKFLRDYYKKENISPVINETNYFQTIPKEFFPEKYNASENVLAFIEGEIKPEEVLIISGHLDHLGLENNEIHYGADDNGSGTVSILEIAQAFKMAEKKGYRPKRSILFMHLTAEEIGLQGSLYYTKNPVFPLENTYANLNIDMIGRVDKRHEGKPDYIYLIGADRISKELHYIAEAVNENSVKLDLDYKYNDEDDSNRYYYRSDHYNFAKHNIPVIFFFNGVHEDYHKPTDTPDKINYPLLEKRTRLIFSTAWYLANKDEKLIHNVDL